jgi:hypothetical protein
MNLRRRSDAARSRWVTPHEAYVPRQVAFSRTKADQASPAAGDKRRQQSTGNARLRGLGFAAGAGRRHGWAD